MNLKNNHRDLEKNDTEICYEKKNA